MDSGKYLEPLVRRAIQEKFPESLHTIFEIFKRAFTHGATMSLNSNAIPGIGENLNDAIRQLIIDNIFTIKGAVMDSITELDVIQKLAELFETQKKLDCLELIFPADNPHVHSLFCKLVSFSLSVKCTLCLRKCAKYLKSLDMSHQLKVAVVKTLRTDFCRNSSINIQDILQLPVYAKDLAVIFINTTFAFAGPSDEAAEVRILSEWLSKDADLLTMVKPFLSSIICWYIRLVCRAAHDEQHIWKIHLAILEVTQQRVNSASHRGVKKHAFLTGENAKSWVLCLSGTSTVATDMVLQLLHVFISTGALNITKDEMSWCTENIPKSEFSQFIGKAKTLHVT